MKQQSKYKAELRKKAEEKIKSRLSELKKLYDNNPHKLIHELEVHQIELEIQNEGLRRSQIKLEESRNKYSDLYDFAPIGYFIFNKEGQIMEINLTGADQLGAQRSFLKKKSFFLYIVLEG